MRIVSSFWVIIAALIANAQGGYEVNIDLDGENRSSDSSPERSVIVQNHFQDKLIELYWEDPNTDEEYSILTIEPNSTATLNTFSGHIFIAKQISDFDIILDEIIILENIDLYSVGLQETKKVITATDGIIREDKQCEAQVIADPQVKIIGKRTTAMAAKFRCLCSSVDYYYDDGDQGLFQGSLLLGKETTINTYEGHIFFFTEKDNKDSEIGRFIMSKHQVS